MSAPGSSLYTFSERTHFCRLRGERHRMARPRHPKKEIEEAVVYAESRGWDLIRSGSHVWGILHCPGRGRGGHRVSVYSTPRNPTAHARDLRREVDRCQHSRGDQP